MTLIGMSGSLRKSSLNTLHLMAARSLIGARAEIRIIDLGKIPLYNQDLDTDPPLPAVAELKAAIGAADGLLFSTPEYNHGVPGVLKNAIDWASRPAFKSVLAGKPSGILSAARGAGGGARAQAQLKQILAGTLTPVYPAPELSLGAAHEAFDASGALINEKARERLLRYLTGLVEWVEITSASS